MIHLYGIPNCSTVQKARAYLESQQIAYEFHDFKKEAPSTALLKMWFAQVGWEKLLNKQGLTWKRLPAEKRQDINEAKLLVLMHENPSMIKRPVLVNKTIIAIGFDEEIYAGLK